MKSSSIRFAKELITKSFWMMSGIKYTLCHFSIKKEWVSCSGLLPPGLNAIMGPTGSGKTRYVALKHFF